jgi:1-acyl-sn-glycerol-3-phosphate acyltransferase
VLSTRLAGRGECSGVTFAMTPSLPFPSDYVSPPSAPGWVRRSFPGLCFYLSLVRIVFGAAHRAKRGRYDDQQWVDSSLDAVRALEAIGVRMTIEGLGHFSGLGGPAVVIGNHMSTLETFVLPGVLQPHRPVTFIVKRQLVEMPVFKHVMIARRPIVVGRANPREDLKTVLDEGEARLRAGISVIVFPQTTRAASWSPAEFNSIGVKLAKRAGVPVVPLALRSDAWGIGRRMKDFGPIRPQLPVRIEFGAPLTVSGNGREAQEALVRFISTRVRAWGVPVIEAAPSAPDAG